MKKKSLRNTNTSKKTGSRRPINGNGKSVKESNTNEITSLILQDHKPIKELLLILKDPKISFAKKRPAFEEFERVLTNHAKAEEESLYVHLKQEDELCIEGIEGETEHAIAERLMTEVNDSRDDEKTWMAKVKVLAEVVDHHVKEEEKEILKEVRKEFDMEKRTEIGEMYSRLLRKHQNENETPRKLSQKEEMRAEHV